MKGLGTRAGVSDVIAVHKGRTFALELKAEGVARPTCSEGFNNKDPVHVSTTIGIPQNSDLIVGGTRRYCHVQWKTGTKIGVKFE